MRVTDDHSTGYSFDRSPSAKFKAGFNECARLVREMLLSQQPQQKMEGDVQKRVIQHLEQYMDKLLILNRRSPSPSLHLSDSCSSFEEKDVAMSSPGSLFHGASSSSSASSLSEEMESEHSRRSSLNRFDTNIGFESSSPIASPYNPDTTSRWNCGFQSVQRHTPPPALVARQVGSFSMQNNPLTSSPNHLYDGTSLTASISHLEKSRVWRPW